MILKFDNEQYYYELLKYRKISPNYRRLHY